MKAGAKSDIGATSFDDKMRVDDMFQSDIAIKSARLLFTC